MSGETLRTINMSELLPPGMASLPSRYDPSSWRRCEACGLETYRRKFCPRPECRIARGVSRACRQCGEATSSGRSPFCCDECKTNHALSSSCKNCGRSIRKSQRYCDETECRKVARAAGGRAGKGRPSSLRGKFGLSSYGSAMHRAHSLVPQGPCALASPDCHGDMRLSLHLDTATPDHLRSERDRNGTVQLFWVGPEDQIRDAYKWMCRYHSRQTHPNIRVAIEKAGRQGAALMAQMASQRRAAQPGTWAEYQRIHKTARNEPGFLDRCLAEDGTCKGRMEAALSPEAPLMYLRYVADNPDHPESDYSTRSVDYFPLCTSHHKRMDLGAESDQDQNHDTEQDTMSCRESPGTGSTDSQK